MRSFCSLVAFAALASRATAYPAVAEAVAKRQGAPDPVTTFNPQLQYVSTSGAHEFQAPNFEAGDQRGPCPGLNAMANHGYLPRNGVGSTLDFITATETVFGMGADLSGFLTVLGSTIDGSGTAWSIGGPSPALPGIGLLGQPQGISASHNKYESDVSPGRGDLYIYGNDFTLQMSQFSQLHQMGLDNGDDVTLDILNEFRSMRFDNSLAQNPYFFNGPFTGVLVQPAAYEFIYRFMGNKSAEYPAGKLNTAVLRSFFGVKKNADGSLTREAGMERIPYNWYKRAVGDEYTIPFLNADTVLAATRYPKFLDVGGNLGKGNSFTGVNIEDISGGVYNSQNLLEGNNLACFASEFATQMTPDLIRCSGVITDIEQAVEQMSAQFTKSFGNLGCPKLSNIEVTQFKKFPGYTDLNCKTGAYP